jgi:hypothetical protein
MTALQRGTAVLHELPDGTPVLEHDGALLVLNATGASVWQLIDGRRTADEIALEIAGVVHAPPDVVRSDVENFLATLRERGLLV